MPVPTMVAQRCTSQLTADTRTLSECCCQTHSVTSQSGTATVTQQQTTPDARDMRTLWRCLKETSNVSYFSLRPLLCKYEFRMYASLIASRKIIRNYCLFNEQTQRVHSVVVQLYFRIDTDHWRRPATKASSDWVRSFVTYSEQTLGRLSQVLQTFLCPQTAVSP